MATVDSDELFVKAKELKERREADLNQSNAIREVLRNMDAAGILSTEESDELEKIFPTRTRKGKDGGEAIDTSGMTEEEIETLKAEMDDEELAEFEADQAAQA